MKSEKRNVKLDKKPNFFKNIAVDWSLVKSWAFYTAKNATNY